MQRPSNRFALVFSVLVLLLSVEVLAAEPSILVRSNPRTYRVRSMVDTVIENAPPTLLLINLPIPSSNPYQEIKNLKADRVGNGVVKRAVYPETGLPYASAVFQNTPLAKVIVDFEVTFFDVSADFSKIEKEYPYNKNSPLYAAYTRTSGVYVVPNHPQIKTIAEKLAKESSGIVDYARKAYDYVGDNFKYFDPGTGLHPLNQILREGGGDCGNYASVFVSLLRCRGIPARHLVGRRPDGSFHIWADFYMEKYGWIPVDPTFGSGNARADFFGKVIVGNPAVILSCDADLTIASIQNGKIVPLKVAMMQTQYWWFHNVNVDAKVTPTFRFEGQAMNSATQ